MIISLKKNTSEFNMISHNMVVNISKIKIFRIGLFITNKATKQSVDYKFLFEH